MTLTGVLCIASVVHADDADDRERQLMQQQLNQQVMASPFNPGDIQKAEDYAELAKRGNMTPVAQVPNYWVPGWTCHSMTAYRYYNYGDYRDCVYYHHYHGRYWR